MDTNSNAVIVLRVSRWAAKNVAVIGVVGCLAVAGLAAAVSGAGTALSSQADTVSVDRTHKGDRLPLTAKVTFTTSSPLVCDGHRWGVTPHSAATPTRRVAISLAAAFREWHAAPPLRLTLQD